MHAHRRAELTRMPAQSMRGIAATRRCATLCTSDAVKAFVAKHGTAVLWTDELLGDAR
jgi:hypothetical protein